MAKKYTEKEIEHSLREIVLADGNISRAAARLELQNRNVPERTLQEWRNTRSERYDWLEANRATWTLEEAAEANERKGRLFTEASDRVVASILRTPDEELDKVTLGVKANAVSALTRARVMSNSNAAELRDKPRQVEETKSMAELLRVLQTQFPQVKVDPQLIEAKVVDDE